MSDTPLVDSLVNTFPETVGLREISEQYNLMLALARGFEREVAETKKLAGRSYDQGFKDGIGGAVKRVEEEREACAVIAQKPLAPTDYAERYSAAIAQLIRARNKA